MTDQELVQTVSKSLSELAQRETFFESKDAVEFYQNLGILELKDGKYHVKPIKETIEILEKDYISSCMKNYHKITDEIFEK